MKFKYYLNELGFSYNCYEQTLKDLIWFIYKNII